MSRLKLNRRQFLTGTATVTGGLVLGMTFTERTSQAMPNQRGDALQPNAWLQITPENEVIFQLDKVEMGQGVYTSMPTIVAEELELDPRKIRVEMAPVHADFQDPIQVTGGSTSTNTRWDVLRETGAKARSMLITAAAVRWGVDASDCYAEEGRIYRRGEDASFSFGELANDAAALKVPEKVYLKDPTAFKYVGKSLRRLDGREKSLGQAVFGIDVSIPDAVNAIVMRNPHFGGGIESLDTSKASHAPGVIDVFRISSGIAIVADTYWHARQATAYVEVVWDKGSLAGVSSDTIRAQWIAMSGQKGASVRDDGNVEKAQSRADEILEVVYEVPYLAHATMEPQNTTARYENGRIEVWSPNQGPDVTRALIADALGISRNRVTVHTTLMGGGFGRRGIPDFAVDAAEVALHIQGAVKVIWSREDDMRHDYYRPATYNVMRAALDGEGMTQSWSHKMVAPSMMSALLPTFVKVAPEWLPDWLMNSVARGAGSWLKTRDGTTHEGAADHPYAIPNVEIRHVFHDPGIPLGFWRSVGHSQNAFVTECFVDELAHKAGIDAYRFRRDLLQGNSRHLAVLDLAAEKAGWGNPSAGRHQGIAVHESFGSVVAEVAEVTVTNGRIKVERVVCAVDCGLVVNPDLVKAQIESGVIFGLTAALKGKITIQDGAVVQSNFHDYPMLRMNESPSIDVFLVASTNRPTGVGEPGTPPIAPAVANAVYAATGERLRTLPLQLS